MRMPRRQTMSVFCKYARVFSVAVIVSAICVTAGLAQTYTVQTFASGVPLSATSPDSVEVGLGSVWISYQNGADSTGLFGSSTVVRYSWTGAVQNTWSVAG